MKAKSVKDWNIVKICDTDDVGIIRNDLLPEGMKRMVCIQFLDKTAVIIEGDSEVMQYKSINKVMYEELQRLLNSNAKESPTNEH